MEINKVYSGFRLERIKDIKDIGSKMYEFKHVKTNASLVYLENDDTNKCFAAGFRTIPENSTGVCHIIEHSVLCGSDKYPLKEPFVNLLKGSMSTFLNAMTADDWTLYPVASQNDKDFSNLMSVYLDAVFNPLSVKDNKPFLQEGWHLELTDKDSMPQYKGVVYNEMKGATSSVDDQLFYASAAALYNGSNYAFNSGGDPDVIPELTYEYYQNFYKKHYHPTNCLLYLYGEMDILEKLDYIDKEYLSKYEMGEEAKINIPPRQISVNNDLEYAISESEELEDNTYYALAFGLDKYENAQDLTAFQILNEVLMGTNESPLKKRLLDSKLGQNFEAMVADDSINPSYHVFLQKSNTGKKEEFFNLFMESCKQILAEGIDKKALLATINNLEFRNKEMDMGRTPKGLFFAFSLMQSFNYHVPYENYLEYTRYFEFYKKELNNGYFEGLLEKYIINSDYYSLVSLNPSKEKGPAKEAEMAEKMANIKASMSPSELDEAIKLTEDLVAYQSKKDTKEELATLPKLAISDINPTVNKLETEYKKIDGVPYLIHEFNTNGIGYMKLYFDFNVLDISDVQYIKILSGLLGNLDTKNYSANDLQSYIKTYLGSVDVLSIYNGLDKEDCKTKFSVQASALEENIDKIPEVLNEMLLNSIFDAEKIKVRLLQYQKSLREEVITRGNNVASDEARSATSKLGALNSKLHGVKMYRFVTALTENFQADLIISKLQEVSAKLFNKQNMLVSLSGDENAIAKMKDAVKALQFSSKKPEVILSVNPDSDSNKALIIPSQVNYNAKAVNLKDLGLEFSGKYFVAEHIINYDYLWPEVRVKGGAYGCRLTVATNGDIAISSFRDPNVKNTYEVYDGISKYLEDLSITQEEFETYLIGAIGGFDQPASNNSRINSEDLRSILGYSYEKRCQLKQEMINTTLKDVKDLAQVFKRLAQMGQYYTVGSDTKIKEFNQFDKVETL